MFTGIIEELGILIGKKDYGTNIEFSLYATFISELKVDQSISHNGVCLTVTSINNDHYQVVAIKETLDKSNLGQLALGNTVNLERCLMLGDRLDGHFVQGHVDTTAICEKIEDKSGSWIFTFSYPQLYKNLLVSKGSVCVNGVSLTISSLVQNSFDVAIIPYTFEHTNFNQIKIGNSVNLEFDILGKYISRQLELGRNPS